MSNWSTTPRTSHAQTQHCSPRNSRKAPRLLDQLILHIGHDDRPVHLAHAELVGRIELPDAVHLVPEQLDAIGMVEGVTEDVDDAAADGVFARLVDVFDLLEPVVDEQLIDEILRNPVPPLME